MVQRTILIIYCRLCSYCRDVVKTENSWKNIHVMCASFWALFLRCKLWSTPLEIFIHLPILKPSWSKLMRHKRQWPWGLIRANDKMRIRVLLHTMIFSTINEAIPWPFDVAGIHLKHSDVIPMSFRESEIWPVRLFLLWFNCLFLIWWSVCLFVIWWFVCFSVGLLVFVCLIVRLSDSFLARPFPSLREKRLITLRGFLFVWRTTWFTQW